MKEKELPNVIKEEDLTQVTGGGVCGENEKTLHNMPKIEPDEKYVMSEPADTTHGPISR